MFRLRNGVQRYDWGSVDAIPNFLQQPPDGRPVAEMWLGTHQLRPSKVVRADGSTVALSEVAGELPFMAKLLAADRPLSLQVHPSRSIAAAGFAREEAAGVPLHAPYRTFKDTNHKPEMVYALSQFDSLVGFRPTAEILRILSPIDTELSHRMMGQLRADPGFSGIVRLVAQLLWGPPSRAEIVELVQSCRSLLARGLDIRRAYATVTQVAAHHRGDVGVVVALLLNRMTLQPGEVAFLETGVIHAHLSGFGFEVMATSDNVLRAGLTNKHVDPVGLVECLDQGMARVARVTPEYVAADTEVYSPAGMEFALAVTQVSHMDPDGVPIIAAPQSILMCTGGEVELRSGDDEKITLSRGESIFTDNSDSAVSVRGLGEVVQVYSPRATAVHSRLVDMI